MDSSIETDMAGYMRVTKQFYNARPYARAFQLVIGLQYSETQFFSHRSFGSLFFLSVFVSHMRPRISCMHTSSAVSQAMVRSIE